MSSTRSKRVFLGVAILAVVLPLGWFVGRHFTPVRPLKLMSPDGSGIGIMSLSPDGLHLAQSLLSTPDPAVRFWNTQTGQIENTFNGAFIFPHSDQGQGITFAVNRNSLVWANFISDSKKLNAVDSKGNLLRFDIATAQQEESNPSPLTNAGDVIVVSPDTKTLITHKGARDQKLLIWDRISGRQKSWLPTRQMPLKSVIFSPDSQIIASREDDNSIKILSATNGHLIRTLPKHRGAVAAMVISPDAKTLISGTDIFKKPSRCELRFWNLVDGVEKQPPIAAPDWIEHLTFSPDGYLVGTGLKSIFFWDVTTGKLVKKVNGCWPVIFDKTGEIMVCGDGDGFERFKNASVWHMNRIPKIEN